MNSTTENTEAPYDSTPDTTRHIKAVGAGLFEIIVNLSTRAVNHDALKLLPPEKEAFDKMTPKLKNLTYNSPEYAASLKELDAALLHHYSVNDHHPQYHGEMGMNGMSLMSLSELLADWFAAGKRHSNGSMARSLAVNEKKFNVSEVNLQTILENTAIELKWATREEIEAAKKAEENKG